MSGNLRPSGIFLILAEAKIAGASQLNNVGGESV
jgi:hypothetical protein